MMNRCFSVCCAFAVLLTGGMLLPAAASAETEAAETNALCETPAVTYSFDDAGLDAADFEEADDVPHVYTSHSFVSLFPAASPAAVASYTPPLHNSWLDEAVFDKSTYYANGTAVLLNGTLYAVSGGKASAVMTGVKDYTHLKAKDETGSVIEKDIVLTKDGRLSANGAEIKLSGIEKLENGYAISEVQQSTQARTLYALVPYKDRVVFTKVTDSFDCFLPDQKERDVKLFFNGTHCIFSCSFVYNSDGAICVSLSDIGIYDPTAVCGNLYLDFQQNLYRLRTEPKIERSLIDISVLSIEYIGSRDGYKLCRYTQTKNRSYEVLTDIPETDSNILCTAVLNAGSGKSVQCSIAKNRTMTGVCGDKQFTVTNVETVLHADMQSGQCCVYFLRTDGSIWMYNFGTKACTELAEGSGSGVKGDLNGDGQFNIHDLTLLQRWINSEEGKIANWKSGDINKDNQLDAVDLALMKRDLIH